MSDMNFRDKLDSELKNIVFSDKSRNRVLERAAERGRAGENGTTDAHEIGVVSGSAAGHESTAASNRVLSRVKAWRDRLYSLMNLELRIPVKPLVVALLISISGIVYACIGVARVSAEDIRRSSITVVDSDAGGQTDGIYKDKG